jgi:hypothetical protein
MAESQPTPEELAALNSGVPQDTEDLRSSELQDPLGELADDAVDDVRGKADEELESASSDSAREAIRERRRLEKRTRLDRRRERDASQQRRLDELTAQNLQMQEQLSAINGNLASSQLNQSRANFQQAQIAVQQQTAAYAAAINAGDGDAAALAMQNMQKAQRAVAYFEQTIAATQGQIAQQRSANPGGAPTPQLNPAMLSKAQAFTEKHSWYRGHKSAEPDSAVLTALDASLAKEGWDPSTQEYWDELEARGRRYLPARFAAGSPKSSYNSGSGGRQQVTSGSGGQSSGGSSTGDFNLSAQRVEAMKEAGHWDDPVKRKAMIAEYRAYDEQNRK